MPFAVASLSIGSISIDSICGEGKCLSVHYTIDVITNLFQHRLIYERRSFNQKSGSVESLAVVRRVHAEFED